MVFKSINFKDVKDVTSKEYLSGEGFASDMFDTKYCHLKENGNRETPAEVFMRVASGLASMESSKELQDKYSQLWFSLLWEGWFRPGGSILTGVGNTRKVSLSNCTTIPLEEDTMESIAKCEYDMMKCAAYRQGLGVDVSRLRPRGAPVSNAAEESTGVVPWATKLNNIGEYVGQKGRMPAVLLSVSVKHPDVEEFIKSKSELGVIENANISIQITNDFMEAVKRDDFWELRFDFKDVKYPPIIKQVKAKELFTLISKTAHASAEPGIQYVDLMAEGTMTQQIYIATDDEKFKPRSSNACCFTEDNHIITDKGKLSIKELRERLLKGESLKALSKNKLEDILEYKEIDNVFDREEGQPVQTITLMLEDGRTIECTPDHTFFTKNRGEVKAKNLTTEDDLISIV